MDAREEILLDQNAMAEGLKFLSIGLLHPSNDRIRLAYATDTTGFRQYSLHVKDLRTGTVLPDTAERVTSLAWAADNATLFYSTEDAVTKRSNLVFRHMLGSKTNEEIYNEKDELFNTAVGASHDRKFVFIESSATNSRECRYLSASDHRRRVQGCASAREGP